MKEKNKLESLIWAILALIAAIFIHFYFPKSLLGQSGKYVLALSFVLNLCQTFNIKVPYISDKKKLPKNYSIYAGINAYAFPSSPEIINNGVTTKCE